MLRSRLFGIAILLLLLVAGGVSAYYFTESKQSSAQHNSHTAFLLEVYDTIHTHYWQGPSHAALSQQFTHAAQQLTDTSFAPATTTRNALYAELQDALAGMKRSRKDTFAKNLAAGVLQNLRPSGRSGLYTQQKEKELSQRVQNVDPNRNLYAVLGVKKGATTSEIEAAYRKTEQKLAQKGTKEAEEALKEVKYAKEVLSNKEQKQRYDTHGAEPTVFARQVSPEVAHIYIERFSPATIDEFVRAAQQLEEGAGGPEPSALILDLRGNVGGAIDILPYLLGPFIGPNTYAYERFKNGETEPVKTKTGWLETLVRYKQVVILVDGNTQSTGEVMAAALKKHGVGTVVGTITRGWGTIERVFPLEHQFSSTTTYSLFLVHTITLRGDGQPIEGRGIHPDISIANSDWRKQLFRHTHNRELINAVAQIWNSETPGAE